MNLKDRERRDLLNRMEGFPYGAELLQSYDRAVARRSHRQQGTTVVMALNTIAIALQYPNIKVVIIDHHGTRNSDRYMAELMRSMMHGMGLKRTTVLMKGPSSPCVVHHPDKETL